jgi:hypothetical protein
LKHSEELQSFAESQDGIADIVKRKTDNLELKSEYAEKRKRIIDDTDKEVKMADLQRVSPWIPQFTPEVKDTKMKEPPKRPSSPMSGRPLKSSDLVPIDLIRESNDTKAVQNENVKYICSVSRCVTKQLYSNDR